MTQHNKAHGTLTLTEEISAAAQEAEIVAGMLPSQSMAYAASLLHRRLRKVERMSHAAPSLPAGDGLTDEQIVKLRRETDQGAHAPRASDLAFARAILAARRQPIRYRQEGAPIDGLTDEITQPWYDLAWKAGASSHTNFAGDDLESLTFTPREFESFCASIAAPRQPGEVGAEPVYDKSVVKRIATQMGWTPPAGEVGAGMDCCTEENCRRCRTPKELRTPEMFHAGIGDYPAIAAYEASKHSMECIDGDCYGCLPASAQQDEREAPDAAWTDLLAYVLQDDLHNCLTPRVIDIAYTAFMKAHEKNTDDGGPTDWFNDTRPVVKEAIEKLRKDLFADRIAQQVQADAGAVPVSRADLEAIDTAMQHLGDVLNGMDAVEAEDEEKTEPGFEAISRILASAPSRSAAESDKDKRELLTAASHALRSYQYGNSSPDLAESIADRIDAAMSREQSGGGAAS